MSGVCFPRGVFGSDFSGSGYKGGRGGGERGLESRLTWKEVHGGSSVEVPSPRRPGGAGSRGVGCGRCTTTGGGCRRGAHLPPLGDRRALQSCGVWSLPAPSEAWEGCPWRRRALLGLSTTAGPSPWACGFLDLGGHTTTLQTGAGDTRDLFSEAVRPRQTTGPPLPRARMRGEP